MNHSSIGHPEHAMTDEELDRDWKPSGRRPQSTIARSFSQELMDIFRIENSVADLDEQVDKRKHQITDKTTELEALEARIREMEARLKNPPVLPRTNQPANTSVQRQTPNSSSHMARPSVPTPLSRDAFPPRGDSKQHQQYHHQQQQQQQQTGGSRPGTARASQQAVPGALPPTPGTSEGEYEDDLDLPIQPTSGLAPAAPAPAVPSPYRGQGQAQGQEQQQQQHKAWRGAGAGIGLGPVRESSHADYVFRSRPDGDDGEYNS